MGRFIDRGQDRLLAGQVKARDLTLVVHDVGEFKRVEDLHVEDWAL
ncbi:hypothetical protein [Sinorhizobium terangae]|nr:hypothetical protein [Sinorhizobium terangae]WFU51641.1 hypothetical protein QA637_25810 [Sinorhizobium terangae]